MLPQTTGVTVKGLLALACHYPNLSFLRTPFQVDSLDVPAVIPGVIPNAEPAASWTDCALRQFAAGNTPVPEGSALAIVLTLLRISPRIDSIEFDNNGRERVENATQ